MAKRELPPRNSRGKNTFYTNQIEKLHSQKTGAVYLKKNKPGEGKNVSEAEKKNKCTQQARRQTYNENKRLFMFTRGIHYFYDLSKLQRVLDSVSYAIFPSKKQLKPSKTNPYSITYSKQKQLIGTQPISTLINRNYIGLPLNRQSQKQPLPNDYIYNEKSIHEVIQMKRNDKNPCHHYLFEAQDKKHNLDRMIAQLQFVLRKFQFYLKPQNIKKLMLFSFVQKDQFLAQNLLDDTQLTHDQKKTLIQQKILALKAKRQKLDLFYLNASETYYDNSLNQRLYNQIKSDKQKLTRFSIYLEMQKSIKEHQKPTFKPENSLILENLHHFHHQSQLSINSEIDSYYCIDQKIVDPFILANVFKLVSIRLFQEGQNCFYFAKKIFLKLFNRQLKLENEIRSVNFEQYANKMKEIEEGLVKFWDRKAKDQNNKNHLKKSKQLCQNSKRAKYNKKVKVQTSKQSLKLRINQKFVPIDFYQFHCLKLFTVIYDSLLIIKQFLQRSENKRLNIVQHMGSLFYPKLESKLVGIIQLPKFGLLSEALDKLIDVILHPKKEFEPMNYELYVQFIEKDRQILTFLKEIQSPSVSNTSSVSKRASSISEFGSQNRENQMEEEGVFCHGRKMVK